MKKEITEEQKTRLANFNFDGPQWKTLTEIGATTSDVPFLRSMKGMGSGGLSTSMGRLSCS